MDFLLKLYMLYMTSYCMYLEKLPDSMPCNFIVKCIPAIKVPPYQTSTHTAC